jgi:hypothetical protein
MRKIIAISGIFALLLGFTACEKKQITPINEDDTIMYLEDPNGNTDTRGGETGGPEPTPGPTPTTVNGINDPVIEGGDGGIVDPDEDEDYDNDDDDNG